MDLVEESTVGRDQRLTLTEIKAWYIGKLEGFTRPSFSGEAVIVSTSLSGLHGAPTCV